MKNLNLNNFKLDELPKLPGIYIFKNASNEIIYIGKAVSIRDRVKSYFAKNLNDWKIDALLEELDSIDYIITSTEEEALILEAQLVKEKQPKFNVLLKEGQPFVYFLITSDELPKLEVVRNKDRKGIYFGPFLNRSQARKVHEYLLREFRLKICNKHIPNGCLDYHLGFCSGSCRSDFDVKDYLFRLELVKDLLKNNIDHFKENLSQKISDATLNLDFEKAAHLHKYLENLDKILIYLEHNYKPSKYESEVIYKSSLLSKTDIKSTDIGPELQHFLHLNFEPKTIDCFDVSHFQGKWIVGSCIRFADGRPDKNKFRRFRIKTLVDQNDYAALQEIVLRRYRNRDEIPDIILIDGGKGQLSAVKSVLPEGYILSLAKREETLFGPGFEDGMKLDLKSKIGHLFVAIRDYAHHFAITYHRKKRSM